MIAFDTDVLTEILLGNSVFVDRAAGIPANEQAIPVVVVEEVIRGRLNVIRRAEAGKAPVSIDLAYHLLQKTLNDFHHVQILAYTPAAESLFQQWRDQKVRVATHDLRIAATCVTQSVKLVSRNRKDFTQIPDLDVEFWA